MSLGKLGVTGEEMVERGWDPALEIGYRYSTPVELLIQH